MIMAHLLDPAFLDPQSAPLIRLLVDVSIKGTLVLLVAGGLTFACRRASAAARHLVWSLALTSILVMPALSILLPAWKVAALGEVMPQVMPRAAQSESLSSTPAPIARPERLSELTLTTQTHPAPPGDTPALPGFEPAASSGPEGAGAALNRAEPASFRFPGWLMLVWVLGACLIFTRLVIGTASVRRIARSAERVTDPSRLSMARSISRRLGLSREVDLLVSERISMPLTFGAFRSVVLLPAEAMLWDDERLQIVLLHELAHVKRKDCLTQLTAHLSCALHWFNPLIWIALRELRIERERACDDYVLHTGTKASDYASHLLDIARSLGVAECSSFATVAIARRSQLEGRLLAILDPSLSRKGLKRMSKYLIALALISMILPLAAIQPKAEARESIGREQPVPAVEPNAVAPYDSSVTPGFAPASAFASRAPQGSQTAERQPETPPEPPPPSIEMGPEPDPAQADGQSASRAERRDLSGVADALAEALKDDDAEIRMNALRALAAMRDPRAIDALVQATKGPNPDMRESALQGLALMNDPRAIEPMIEALKDESPQVRERAAWGLGLQHDARVVDPLINALGDENGQVREKAAWSLGLKHDRRAVDPLIAALRDEKAEVREKAAWALGLIGDERAEAALNAATTDPNPQVRERAEWSLRLMSLKRGSAQPPSAWDGGRGAGVSPNVDAQSRAANRLKLKLNTAIKIRD